MVVPPRCGARVGRCQYYEAFVSIEANASLFAHIALCLIFETLTQSDLPFVCLSGKEDKVSALTNRDL